MPQPRLHGTVVVTYRCNAKCNMCDCFKFPTKPAEEITLDTVRKLPEMVFTNITGGEPFIRADLPDIVRELYKKTQRIVVSTNGYFTERVIALCEEFPQIGIRISIEGLQEANDGIRGIPDGFNRGYNALQALVKKGHPDVGFGMTIQDLNADDLLALYRLADEMGMEFATATLHNSFYFRKLDNKIVDKGRVSGEIVKLINELLRSQSPKKWGRAYFNYGLINYIYGNPRPLPCEMGTDAFFVDPYGDVIPCNGMTEKAVMGNLNEQEWDDIWDSRQAQAVREQVRHCERNCWMIGSASPAIKKHIVKCGLWALRHKLPGGAFDLSEVTGA